MSSALRLALALALALALLVLAAQLGALPLSAAPLSDAPLSHVRLRTQTAAQLEEELAAAGFDVLEGTVTPDSLDLVVSEAELSALRARGLLPETLAVGRPFRDIQRERARAGAVPGGYPTLSEIAQSLQTTSEAYPGITQLVDLSGSYATDPSFEGRHLHALKISDNAALREDEPAFLMVSNHHAREIVTPMLALDAIERLTSGYGIDPVITDLVDSYEIWIAPVWNPDGYTHVFEVDNMWRKNRREFADGVGVDLNRNYPQGWDADCGGSTDVDSNTYRGPDPASEAETQTMLALASDQHFAKLIDYHSSGREVLYAYSCSDHPWVDFLMSEAVELSHASGYAGDTRAPSAEGEHYEWQLARMGSHALTETQTEFQPDHASALEEAERVWPGTLWLLERPIPVWGHVTDACSGEPLVATLSYPDVVFENGETNASFLPFGRYHAFPPPGLHRVAFSASGYLSNLRTVSVTFESSEQLEVALMPEDGCPPECDPSELSTLSLLKGAKDSLGGARFQWLGESEALEYHLVSVDHKDWLNATDLRQRPLGQAVLECRGLAPGCTDPDATRAASLLLYYQAVSACGRSPEDEGPAL